MFMRRGVCVCVCVCVRCVFVYMCVVYVVCGACVYACVWACLHWSLCRCSCRSWGWRSTGRRSDVTPSTAPSWRRSHTTRCRARSASVRRASRHVTFLLCFTRHHDSCHQSNVHCEEKHVNRCWLVKDQKVTRQTKTAVITQTRRSFVCLFSCLSVLFSSVSSFLFSCFSFFLFSCLSSFASDCISVCFSLSLTYTHVHAHTRTLCTAPHTESRPLLSVPLQRRWAIATRFYGRWRRSANTRPSSRGSCSVRDAHAHGARGLSTRGLSTCSRVLPQLHSHSRN